jgi:hypothetical protein
LCASCSGRTTSTPPGRPPATADAPQSSGCSSPIAGARRIRRTALTVYRRHVEDIIGRKDKRAYEHAVEIMRTTVRALFAECGRSDEFPNYVAEVRGAHKPKRNLMKLMAALP